MLKAIQSVARSSRSFMLSTLSSVKDLVDRDNPRDNWYKNFLA